MTVCFVTTELCAGFFFSTVSEIIFLTAAFSKPGTLDDPEFGYMWHLSQSWIKAFALNQIYVEGRKRNN